MDDKEIFLNTYFPDFTVLEGSYNLLKQYIDKMNLNERETCRKIIQINNKAKETLNSSVIDIGAMNDILKSVGLPVKNTKYTAPKRSFKEAINEYEEENSKSYHKNEFLYNNSIIYSDAFIDFPEYIFDNKYIDVKILFQEINEKGECENKRNIFGLAKNKIKAYLAHYEIIKFSLIQNGYNNYVSINSLEGSTGEKDIFGILLFSEKDKVLIQDSSKFVQIDVSKALIGEGFYPEGCIVIAHGEYKNDVFDCRKLSHPPIFSSKRTFKEKYDFDFFGSITKAFKLRKNNKNSLGNDSNIKTDVIQGKNDKMWENLFKRDLSTKKILFPKQNENKILIQSETQAFNKINISTEDYLNEEFFLIISNPDLTSKHVLKALEKLLLAFQHHIPFMIIFIGSFLPETSFNSFNESATIFENLANLIFEKNREIAKNTYIVIMPGPSEISLSSAFPKHPFNQSILETMKKKLNLVFSVSNPARFSIFGKEIVIFKDNLNKKLSRYSIFKTESQETNHSNLVHTILAQKSLCPLNLGLTPRIWDFSNSMILHPLPEFLCLADLTKDYSLNTNDTIVFNPGNFSKDFSFSLINPSKKEIQPSKINL
jgi:hypothetical protein